MDAEKIYTELVQCEQIEPFISDLSDATHYLGNALERLSEETESGIEIPSLETAWTTIEMHLRAILSVKQKKDKTLSKE